MKDIYLTITGTKYYYNMTPFKIGSKFKCVKEPTNPYDSNAIKVKMKQLGTVGYIANSPYTTTKGTIDASRVYELVKKKFTVEVMFVTSSKVICKVVAGRVK